MIRRFAIIWAGGLLAMGGIAQAQDVAFQTPVVFGDDASEWSNDGECDDPRFVGEGMTSTPLMAEDAFHDASDCEAAFEIGAVRLRTEDDPSPEVTSSLMQLQHDGVDFGDDSGLFTNDGECDDPRFIGDGMAQPPLLDDDIASDATDCMAAFSKGSIRLRTDADRIELPEGLLMGDNSSRWAHDVECDDPRFEGWGVASKLISTDVGRDAADCQAAFELGHITLVEGAENISLPPIRPVESIDFGDDSSSWSGDSRCDDPRFEGAASASKLSPEDTGRDALDCRAAYENGRLRYVGD